MFSLISLFFNTVLIDPLTNLFVLLTAVTGNAGLAVILLTIIIRMITLPLQLKQMHSMRVMAVINPRIQELQKRYKDPKRRQEETMKIYKEAGINPFGCFSSMLLQFPILIALYRTFSVALGQTPEALIKVSQRLYSFDILRNAMPLPGHFLWLDLGKPDALLMPLMVGITTYVQQKMAMLPATDERQRAQNSMMNLLFPMMFVFITLNLPSGLGLYYVLSNCVGIAMQYLYVGGGPVNWRALIGLSQEAVLPRAVSSRNAQMESLKRIGRSDDEDDDEPEDEADEPGNAAPARRAASSGTRRRYTNGRRRGRR